MAGAVAPAWLHWCFYETEAAEDRKGKAQGTLIEGEEAHREEVGGRLCHSEKEARRGRKGRPEDARDAVKVVTAELKSVVSGKPVRIK